MKLTRRRKIALVLLALPVMAIGTALGVVWRGIPFPKPSGPYAVGRTSYHLVDPSRSEIFTQEPDDVRELMITVHYPADQADRAPRASYADASLTAGIAKTFDTPEFVIHLGHSHALEKPACEPSEGGFPVVVFSPGFGQPPLFYTATLEELASHGFVVVSVYHPYSNGITVFPDGRVALQNEAGSHPEITLGESDSPLPPELPQGDDVGTVWVKDVRFVLDELTRMNHEDPLLAGRLDVARVGIFGHSFGGATAARTVQTDERFRAGINMDGTDFLATCERPIERPFLWMSAILPDVTDEQLAQLGKSRAWWDAARRMLLKRNEDVLSAAAHGKRIVIQGAQHQTFTSDFMVLKATLPWSWLTRALDLGTLPGQRAVTVVDACIVGFFQTHLQNRPSPLLQGPEKDFPEVELKIGPRETGA